MPLEDQVVAAILNEAKPQVATVPANIATLNTAICTHQNSHVRQRDSVAAA